MLSCACTERSRTWGLYFTETSIRYYNLLLGSAIFSPAGVHCFGANCLLCTITALFYLVRWLRLLLLLLLLLFEVMFVLQARMSVQLVRCFFQRLYFSHFFSLTLFTLDFGDTKSHFGVLWRLYSDNMIFMDWCVEVVIVLWFLVLIIEIFFKNRNDFSRLFWNEATARDELVLALIQMFTQMAAGSSLLSLLCTFSASVRERPRLHDCLFWLVLDFIALHF